MYTYYGLLEDLRELQTRCERKVDPIQQGCHGLWARGVLFGVEIGRNRIAEYRMRSLGELKALSDDWERISRLKEVSSVAASTRGIDFGIRLVIVRVRRYSRCLPRPQFRYAASPPADSRLDWQPRKMEKPSSRSTNAPSAPSWNT